MANTMAPRRISIVILIREQEEAIRQENTGTIAKWLTATRIRQRTMC
ncbi:MAG: hypothetical protein GPOALKHO_001745 [Sodalis sp.]|nr:MAG: hypothetical protein GPOALKHO_001745 [Sodalis sp.]